MATGERSKPLESIRRGNDWILFLDADERISTELKNNIISIFPSTDNCCYWIQRKNYFNSEQISHGILRPDWVARLMPTKDSRVEGLVHPKIICPYENRRLKGHLLHHPYKSWIIIFQNSTNIQNCLRRNTFASGRRCSFFRDIILRPLWAFLKVYFINKGFLDGKYGLVFFHLPLLLHNDKIRQTVRIAIQGQKKLDLTPACLLTQTIQWP